MLKAGLRENFTKSFKPNAKRRGIPVTITFEQYKNLMEQTCIYGSRTAKGLDRRSNDEGYTPENSTPCCPRHNMMKGRFFSHEDMLFIVNNIDSAKPCDDIRGIGSIRDAKPWKGLKKQGRVKELSARFKRN